MSTVTPAALVRPATTGCRGHKDARSLRRPLPAARVVSYYGLSNEQLDGDRVVCRSSDASFVGGATVWMMADKKVTAPSALKVCTPSSAHRDGVIQVLRTAVSQPNDQGAQHLRGRSRRTRWFHRSSRTCTVCQAKSTGHMRI